MTVKSTKSKKISIKNSVTTTDVAKAASNASVKSIILKVANLAKSKKASLESNVMSDSPFVSPLKKSSSEFDLRHQTTEDEVSASKNAERERNELLHRVTSVLFPLHVGNANVEKPFNNVQLRPETVLCLMFIGSEPDGMSKIRISLNLRLSGFDIRESMPISFLGMSSMIDSKLGKWAKKQNPDATDSECILQKMVLTAKGKKIFDITKRSVLSSGTPQFSYI